MAHGKGKYENSRAEIETNRITLKRRSVMPRLFVIRNNKRLHIVRNRYII